MRELQVLRNNVKLLDSLVKINTLSLSFRSKKDFINQNKEFGLMKKTTITVFTVFTTFSVMITTLITLKTTAFVTIPASALSITLTMTTTAFL